MSSSGKDSLIEIPKAPEKWKDKYRFLVLATLAFVEFGVYPIISYILIDIPRHMLLYRLKKKSSA